MKDTKFIKGYCKITKQNFGLEIKQFGRIWKVVNFINITAEEAAVMTSEVRQDSFLTNENLLPCKKCGSRVVSGCSCSKNSQCSAGKYNFQCIYCKNMQIDYSASLVATGYKEGDVIRLSQGQEVKICFADNKPLKQIYVGVGWDPAYGINDMDVDSSVVVAGQGCYELIYFGNLLHPSGCVVHHGDNLTGETKGQGDDENITVNLSKVPSERDKIIFILNIYKCKERHQNLGRVKNLYIRLYDPDSRQVLIEYRVLDNMQCDTGIIIGMAYRKKSDWFFKAIGKGSKAEDVNSLALESIRI